MPDLEREGQIQTGKSGSGKPGWVLVQSELNLPGRFLTGHLTRCPQETPGVSMRWWNSV